MTQSPQAVSEGSLLDSIAKLWQRLPPAHVIREAIGGSAADAKHSASNGVGTFMGVCQVSKRIVRDNEGSMEGGGGGEKPGSLGGIARRIDIKSYALQHLPFALLHMTGSGAFNQSIRLFAKKRYATNAPVFPLIPAPPSLRSSILVSATIHPLSGYKLCDRDLRETISDNSFGPPIPCGSEEEVFQALGLPYRVSAVSMHNLLCHSHPPRILPCYHHRQAPHERNCFDDSFLHAGNEQLHGKKPK